MHGNYKGCPINPVDLQGGSIEAVVPGTVLTTLIHNGVYPDPDIGLNRNLIPDVYHTGCDFYTYWFHNSFVAPKAWSASSGGQGRLILHGINYSARHAALQCPVSDNCHVSDIHHM